MPYKDPERKRQWEREHREQRNVSRRIQRFGREARVIVKPAPPTLVKETDGGWQTILGLAVGLGFVLLAALSGVELFAPNDPPL